MTPNSPGLLQWWSIPSGPASAEGRLKQLTDWFGPMHTADGRAEVRTQARTLREQELHLSGHPQRALMWVT